MPSAPLDDAALDEAATRFASAQQHADDNPSTAASARLDDARRALAELRLARSKALPEGGSATAELAMAVGLFRPLLGSATPTPPAIARLVGDGAHADEQCRVGMKIVEYTMSVAELAILDTGIELLKLALPVAIEQQLDRPVITSYLCLAHNMRYDLSGARTDLEQAVDFGAEALATLPEDHPEYVATLSNLGVTYDHLFDLTDDPGCLDESITYGERAVALDRGADPDLPASMTLLATSYRRRHELTGARSDLDSAIALTEDALALTPTDSRHHPLVLANLMLAFSMRYRSTRERSELDKIITIGEEALGGLEHGHPERASVLGNLALQYSELYEHTGDREHLDRAIALGEECSATTTDASPGRATQLSSLATIYHTRFVRSGNRADIDRTITLSERSLALTPPQGREYGLRAANHAAHLYARYDLAWDYADLDSAISLAEHAASDKEDPQHLTRLTTLAALYHKAGERRPTESSEFHSRAIAIGERVLALARPNDPDVASWKSNLGMFYLDRYLLDRNDLADLERADTLSRSSIESTATTDADYALRLSNFLSTQEHSMDVGREAIDVPAITAYATALARAQSSMPHDRMIAGRKLGLLANRRGAHTVAVRLLDETIEVLPSIVLRDTPPIDREQRLGDTRDLVTEAVAAHCELGSARSAVQVADLGRGIALREALDAHGDATDSLADRTQPAELVGALRDEPNTDPLDTLRRTGTPGTVVLVNAGAHRGDAILLDARGDPRIVRLPGLASTDVKAHVEKLAEAVAIEQSVVRELYMRRVLGSVLPWLWETVAEPIVEAVRDGDLRADAEAMPRIWWLPIGQLGLLPFHAAGKPGEPACSMRQSRLSRQPCARSPTPCAGRRRCPDASSSSSSNAHRGTRTCPGPRKRPRRWHPACRARLPWRTSGRRSSASVPSCGPPGGHTSPATPSPIRGRPRAAGLSCTTAC